jgi:hypothetical protein
MLWSVEHCWLCFSLSSSSSIIFAWCMERHTVWYPVCLHWPYARYVIKSKLSAHVATQECKCWQTWGVHHLNFQLAKCRSCFCKLYGFWLLLVWVVMWRFILPDVATLPNCVLHRS